MPAVGVRLRGRAWAPGPPLLWCVLALAAAACTAAGAAQCSPGFTGPDGNCSPCPVGTYKIVTGDGACVWCGVGGTTAAPASTAEDNCSCAAGYLGPYRREAAGFLWGLASLAGSDARGAADGVGAQARFSQPRGVAFSPDTAFLACAVAGGVGVGDDVADYPSAIRIVATISGNVTTLAGGKAAGFVDGVGTNATFNNPSSVAYSPDGLQLAVADEGNHAIRLVHVPTRNVTTLAGTGTAAQEGAVSDGVAGGSNSFQPTFWGPQGVAWSPMGGLIAVAEYNAHRVRSISIGGIVTVTTLAGGAGVRGFVDGVGTNARFTYPTSVSFSPDGMSIAVAERQSQTGGGRGDALRLIHVNSGNTRTLAGGTGQDGVLEYPTALAFSPDGLEIVIAEFSKTQRIQRFRLSTGEMTEIMVGTTTGILKMRGIAWSPRDAKLAVSTSQKHTIWLLDGPGCSRCRIGKYTEFIGASSCTECAKGKYHDFVPGGFFPARQNASSCSSCIEGKYSTASGATTSYSCLDCGPGKYGTVQASFYEANCSSCVPGTYSNASGASALDTCLACGPGKYSTKAAAHSSSLCLMCQAGKFNNGTGMTVCRDCAQGKYVETSGSDAEADCILCGTSKYSGAYGANSSTTCKTCPIQMFSLELGATSNHSCLPCAKGALCQNGAGACALQNEDFVCPNGERVIGDWRANDNATPRHYELTSCPAAYELRKTEERWNSVFNASLKLCQASNCSCTQGALEVGGGLSRMQTHNDYDCGCSCEEASWVHQECYACPATSTYILNPNQDTCQPCPVGFTCYGDSTVDKTKGVWVQEGAFYKLISCTQGHFVHAHSPFLQQCLPCGAGEECIDEECHVCTRCKAGWHKNATGPWPCNQCPADTYSSIDATTCTACSSHSNSPAGSSGKTHCVCNFGFRGPNGGICLGCEAGTYDSRSQQDTGIVLGGASGPIARFPLSSCSACPWGKYSTTVAASSSQTCLECGQGKYSNRAFAESYSYRSKAETWASRVNISNVSSTLGVDAVALSPDGETTFLVDRQSKLIRRLGLTVKSRSLDLTVKSSCASILSSDPPVFSPRHDNSLSYPAMWSATHNASLSYPTAWRVTYNASLSYAQEYTPEHNSSLYYVTSWALGYNASLEYVVQLPSGDNFTARCSAANCSCSDDGKSNTLSTWNKTCGCVCIPVATASCGAENCSCLLQESGSGVIAVATTHSPINKSCGCTCRETARSFCSASNCSCTQGVGGGVPSTHSHKTYDCGCGCEETDRAACSSLNCSCTTNQTASGVMAAPSTHSPIGQSCGCSCVISARTFCAASNCSCSITRNGSSPLDYAVQVKTHSDYDCGCTCLRIPSTAVNCTSDKQMGSFVGSGTEGFQDGRGTAVQFYAPTAIAISPVGDEAFVLDGGRIRLIDLATHDVRVLAGSTVGLRDPDAAVTRVEGSVGQYLYKLVFYTVSGHRTEIMRNEAGWKFSRSFTLASGEYITGIEYYPFTATWQSYLACGLAFFTNKGNNFTHLLGTKYHDSSVCGPVQRWKAADGNMITAVFPSHSLTGDQISGIVQVSVNGSGFQDGVGKHTLFKDPKGLAISPNGSTVFVADTGNNAVRSIDVATQQVRTLAGPGDGQGSYAFDSPQGLAVSVDGQTVFVADTGSHRIRAIDIASGTVRTLAGSEAGYQDGFQDGNSSLSRFDSPRGLAVAPDGLTLLVVDSGNHVVRTVDILRRHSDTLVGTGAHGLSDGRGTDAILHTPHGLAITRNGSIALVAENGNQLRVLYPAVVQVPSGFGTQASCLFCAAGTYSATFGAVTNATCKNCEANTYSTGGANTCLMCANHSNSPAVSDSPNRCACNAGYSGRGSLSCSICPANTFWTPGVSDGFMQYTCKSCPAFSSSPVASTWCTCDAGYATVSSGVVMAATSELQDLETSALGLTCSACEAGTAGTKNPARPSGFSVSYCSKCKPGQYAPEQASTGCLDCATGSFASMSGASVCLRCPAGSSSPKASTGMHACLCAYGYSATDRGPTMWQGFRDTAPQIQPGPKMCFINGTLYEFSTGLFTLDHISQSWTTLGAAEGVQGDNPGTRMYHGLTGLDLHLYVYGGCTELEQGSLTNCVGISEGFFQFAVRAQTWTDATSVQSNMVGSDDEPSKPPGPRAFHAFTAANGAVYLHGGLRRRGCHDDPGANSTCFSGEFFKFDLSLRKWQVLATTGASPGAFYGHGLASAGKILFMFGGFDVSDAPARTLSNQLLRFHTLSNVWSNVQAEGAPSARAGHGFVVLGDKLFVHGGMAMVNGAHSAVDDLYQFLIDDNRWQQIQAAGEAPLPRYFHAIGGFDATLIVHGGLASETSVVDRKVVKYGKSLACLPLCKPGSFSVTLATGATTCMFCPAGKFSTALGVSKCDVCPPGIESSINSTVCRLCPADTYLDSQKSSDKKLACKACPTRSHMSYAGSTRSGDCTLDVSDVILDIKFMTNLTFFNGASGSFETSIAAVLLVNASRVNLMSAERRSVAEDAKIGPWLVSDAPTTDGSIRSRRDEAGVTASFQTRLPKTSPSRRSLDPTSALESGLSPQLRSDGLPYQFEILNVMIACGTGAEPKISGGAAGAICKPCPTTAYKNTSDNAACTMCPRHSATKVEGSKSIMDCECVVLEGYMGPAGGPCFRNLRLSSRLATEAASAVSGVVGVLVSSHVLLSLAGGKAAPSSDAPSFASAGTMTLITQVQYLNLAGRIGGSRASDEFRVFTRGLRWINFDVGLFGNLTKNLTASSGSKFAIMSVYKNNETNIWDVQDCDWTAVALPLEMVTTCALVMLCVSGLRAISAYYVTEILERKASPLMQFPVWEGTTFVVQYLGYIDAVLQGLLSSCNIWMMFCSGVLLLMPATFAAFALVWIRLNRHDGNIEWTHSTKPTFQDLAVRLRNSSTILVKCFTLQIWREERTQKGVWNTDSDHTTFWSFLISEYCVYEFAIWMLLKRTLFAIVLTFVVDDATAAEVGSLSRTANPISIIVIQALDFVLICVLWPWTARSVDLINIVCSFFSLAAISYIAVPIFEGDEDLYPWWINSLGAMFVSLLPTIVASLYSISCLIETILHLIFSSMDKNGASAAAANAIAHQSRQAAEYRMKEVEDDEVEDDEEALDEQPGRFLGDGDGSRGRTRSQAKDAVSVDLVQVQTNGSSSRSPSRSPTRSRSMASPVLSPEDLAAFGREETEEQLKKEAAELAMMRRERERCRVARASKRVEWTGHQEFGTNGDDAESASKTQAENREQVGFSLLTWLR